MFFLLRMAFWLALICVLLPGHSQSQAPGVDAVEAVSMASATVSDLRGFCERQPQACTIGGKIAAALGEKAEAGARTLVDFVTAKLASAAAPGEKAAPIAGHGTLTAADLQPAWHGPVPLPPRREPRGRPSA